MPLSTFVLKNSLDQKYSQTLVGFLQCCCLFHLGSMKENDIIIQRSQTSEQNVSKHFRSCCIIIRPFCLCLNEV